MKKDKLIRSSAAEYLNYVAATGENGVTINGHIKNIYKDNELDEDTTIRKFLIVQKEKNREGSRKVTHYNLQMVITIGFKVDNERAVQFRKWANQIVKYFTIEHIAI